MTVLLLWLSVGVSSLTLMSFIFAAARVVHKQEREWARNEDRLDAVERDVAKLQGESKELVVISAKLQDIAGEIERVRNRLDKFLDVRGGPV